MRAGSAAHAVVVLIGLFRWIISSLHLLLYVVLYVCLCYICHLFMYVVLVVCLMPSRSFPSLPTLGSDCEVPGRRARDATQNEKDGRFPGRSKESRLRRAPEPRKENEGERCVLSPER